MIKLTLYRPILLFGLLTCLFLSNCADQPGAEADRVIVTVVEKGQEYPYINSSRAEVIRYFREFTAGKPTGQSACEPSARIEFFREGRELIRVDLSLDRQSNCWTASWQEENRRVTRQLSDRADEFASELMRLARRRHDAYFLNIAQAVKS